MQKWLPKNKQIFTEADPSESSTVEVDEPSFVPEEGLHKVWNDRKIYLDEVKMYLEKSGTLLTEISSIPSVDEKIKLTRELRTISDSVGAIKIKGMLSELINIGNIGEGTLFDARLERVLTEHSNATAAMRDYAEKEEKEQNAELLTMI